MKCGIIIIIVIIRYFDTGKYKIKYIFLEDTGKDKR